MQAAYSPSNDCNILVAGIEVLKACSYVLLETLVLLNFSSPISLSCCKSVSILHKK